MCCIQKPKRSRLSDSDWNQICTFFDSEGNMKDGVEPEFRSFLEQLAGSYSTAPENNLICPICGNKKSPIYFWCMSCEADFFTAKRIRVARRKKNTSKKRVCAVCGKSDVEFVAKGLCKQCYRRRYNRLEADIRFVENVNETANSKRAKDGDEEGAVSFRKVQW